MILRFEIICKVNVCLGRSDSVCFDDFDQGCRPFHPLSTFSAVKYLHDKGVTHRDIKLDNILRSSSGSYKLCDFGSCIQVLDMYR